MGSERVGLGQIKRFGRGTKEEPSVNEWGGGVGG